MLHFRFFINKIFLNYMLVCVYSFKCFSQFIYKKNKKKIKNVEHGIFRKKIEVMWQSKLSGIEVMRQVTVVSKYDRKKAEKIFFFFLKSNKLTFN